MNPLLIAMVLGCSGGLMISFGPIGRAKKIASRRIKTAAGGADAGDRVIDSLALGAHWATEAALPWDEISVPAEVGAAALRDELAVANPHDRESVRAALAHELRAIADEAVPMIETRWAAEAADRDFDEPDLVNGTRAWRVARAAWLIRCATGVGAISDAQARSAILDLDSIAFLAEVEPGTLGSQLRTYDLASGRYRPRELRARADLYNALVVSGAWSDDLTLPDPPLTSEELREQARRLASFGE